LLLVVMGILVLLHTPGRRTALHPDVAGGGPLVRGC